MAIIQISKIQQRYGDLVDLPQLSEAELGFATDEKRLFIGKTTGTIENVEVLTSYSNIAFDQLVGSYGNLSINPLTIDDGQVLAYDSTANAWVNRGGNAGGLLTFGNVANVKIDGGAIGYVLQTDGTGNLTWAPKTVVTAYVLNASNASPCVITTTIDNEFVNQARVTLTNLPGISGSVADTLNGETYFIDVLTSNTFALYQDANFTLPVSTAGDTEFPYTTAANSVASGNIINIGDSTLFTVNDPIIFFDGDLDTANSQIEANVIYYIKTANSSPGGTQITISDYLNPNGTAGNTLAVGTATFDTAYAYTPGGRAITPAAAAGNVAAGGSNTTIQYNDNNFLAGDSAFTYDFANHIMTLNGNANVGNLNSTTLVKGQTLQSTVATGTAPINVASTTKVVNLNADLLDGYDTSMSAVANTVVVRDANANITGNYLVGTIATTTQPNIQLIGNGVQLTIAGNLIPNSTSNSFDLGSSANRWHDLYLSGNSIYIGNSIISSNANALILQGPNGANITVEGSAGQTSITNGNSNVTISANGNVSTSVSGNANILVVTGNGIEVNGNITANYFIGTANVASQINIGNSNVSNATANFYLLYANGTGNQSVEIDNFGTPLVYQPFTGQLRTNILVVDDSVTNGAGEEIAFDGSNNSIRMSVTGQANALTISNTAISFNTPQANLGPIANITITGGSAGNVLTTYGNGTLYWGAGGGGGGGATGATGPTGATGAQGATGSAGTAGGSNTQVQFNDGGGFAGNASLTFDKTTGILTAGTVLTTTLTTGANSTAGTITGNWTLSTGSKLQATYADLAEYYAADQKYPTGTVLEFGGEQEVTVAGIESNKLAGVISSEPAYVMNSNLKSTYPVMIALIGRVPVRVIGKVNKGDMLISAGDGFAKAANMTPKVGTVIGKAIANKLDDGEGIVEVMVGRM